MAQIRRSLFVKTTQLGPTNRKFPREQHENLWSPKCIKAVNLPLRFQEEERGRCATSRVAYSPTPSNDAFNIRHAECLNRRRRRKHPLTTIHSQTHRSRRHPNDTAKQRPLYPLHQLIHQRRRSCQNALCRFLPQPLCCCRPSLPLPLCFR